MKKLPQTASALSTCCLAAICALLAFTISGCASSSVQSWPKQSSGGSGDPVEIEELPSQPEYSPPDSATRGKVHVRVPEGYASSGYREDMEPYTGEKVELDATLVDMGDAGKLQILVDDAGVFDSWYGGSAYGTAAVAEYVEAATAAGQGSSWAANIGGHEGVVFIDGTAGVGGETAGSAFAFLDGATVAISAVLPDGETAPDAYSAFFRSSEVTVLIDQLEISED